MCKLPPLLKIITVSLYISFLFLGKTVSPFILFICINDPSKAGIAGALTKAEPWYACLKDLALLQPQPCQGAGMQGAPSQTNGKTESPNSFTNVSNIAASLHALPAIPCASPCLQSA